MPLDTTELSTLSLELIERLADDYEDWADVQVGVVSLVVEINGMPPEDDLPDDVRELAETDRPGATVIEYRCSDSRRWIQWAIFRRAAAAASYDED